jgi:hypothetical protein
MDVESRVSRGDATGKADGPQRLLPGLPSHPGSPSPRGEAIMQNKANSGMPRKTLTVVQEGTYERGIRKMVVRKQSQFRESRGGW